jgi:predicted regulator of Ras-like GTPase activity (Roadblock/LC7/MglB family)
METSMPPRYRYYEEAPERVTVPARELLARIPGEFRSGGDPGDRMVDLPAAELLRGNTPRLSPSLLRKLLPDLIVEPAGGDPSALLLLPPGWIALHFRMVTRREELPNAAKVSEQPASSSPVEIPTVTEPAAVPPAVAAIVESAAVSLPVPEEPKPESKPALTPTPSSEPAAPTGSTRSMGSMGSSDEVTPTGAHPKKGIFASLPIFRRREAPPPAQALPEAVTAPPTGPSPAPVTGGSLVLEPLWKLGPQDTLADPGALQALFMTEEKLTLEKVIAKAGELPGLEACVLAHGDRVLSASKTHAGVDLQSLSGHALTMLSQIRDSSSRMGLGAVPAVTLHADQGVVSFLHKGELCLLVLHAERGFIPGVRERLQEMLGHLAEARPALPGAEPVMELNR